MDGKGIFIWQLDRVGDGTAADVLRLVREGGFDRIEVKCADGSYAFNGSQKLTLLQYQDKIRRLRETARDAGIAVWGWGFNYLIRAAGEGMIAAKMVEQFDLDGWIWDWESRADSWTDRVKRSRQLRSAYEDGTDKPAAFCSWPMYWNPLYPAYAWHPRDCLEEMMSWCVAGMAMAYWQKLVTSPYDPASEENARYWLVESVKQWRVMTQKPLIPTGRAYDDAKLKVTPAAIQAFADAAVIAGCQGISWWSLEHAVKMSDPEAWPVLAATPSLGGGVVLTQKERLRRVEAWAMSLGYRPDDWR